MPVYRCYISTLVTDGYFWIIRVQCPSDLKSLSPDHFAFKLNNKTNTQSRCQRIHQVRFILYFKRVTKILFGEIKNNSDTYMLRVIVISLFTYDILEPYCRGKNKNNKGQKK